VDWLGVVSKVAIAPLLVCALLLARRDRSHLPMALWALWVLVDDATRDVIRLGMLDAPRPYAGWFRVLHHVDQLLVFSWPAAFVALVLRHFTRLRPVWAALPFGLMFLLCLDYPAMRGEPARAIYLAAQLYTVGASWSAILVGVFGGAARPRPVHLVVMLLASNEVLVAALPFAGDFVRDWDIITRAANTTTYLACAAVLLRVLLTRPAISRSEPCDPPDSAVSV
jgi:hypothetical protein